MMVAETKKSDSNREIFLEYFLVAKNWLGNSFCVFYTDLLY